MNKEEMKRRISEEIDQNDEFAAQVEVALETNNRSWLAKLFSAAVGLVTEAVKTFVQTLVTEWFAERREHRNY